MHQEYFLSGRREAEKFMDYINSHRYSESWNYFKDRPGVVAHLSENAILEVFSKYWTLMSEEKAKSFLQIANDRIDNKTKNELENIIEYMHSIFETIN